MREPGEDDPADDRPDDRERTASDHDDEELRQVEHARQPCADERAQKPEQNRDDEASGGAAGDSASDRATDSGDHEVNDEFEDGHAF